MELFPSSLICLGFSLAVSLSGYKKLFGIINVYDKVSANTAAYYQNVTKNLTSRMRVAFTKMTFPPLLIRALPEPETKI